MHRSGTSEDLQILCTLSLLASRHLLLISRLKGPTNYYNTSTAKAIRPVPPYRPPPSLLTSYPNLAPKVKNTGKLSPPPGQPLNSAKRPTPLPPPTQPPRLPLPLPQPQPSLPIQPEPPLDTPHRPNSLPRASLDSLDPP